MVSISYAAASDVDGLPPSSAPAAPRAEELLRAFDSIELDVDGSRGVGVLHVTTRRVVWITAERGDDGDAATPTGFAFAFPAITLHSVCRDVVDEVTGAERQCIYCQVDVPRVELGGDAVRALLPVAEEEEEEEEESSYGALVELRFVPCAAAAVADPAATAVLLRDIFDTMSRGAALNPGADDGDGGGLGFGGLGALFGGGAGEEALGGGYPISEASAWDPAVLAAMGLDGGGGEGGGASGDAAVPSEEERNAMIARLDSLVDDSAIVGAEKFAAQQFEDK